MNTNGETPRILVVDDDEKIRTLLTKYLENENLAVSAVDDGKSMDEKLASEDFDLVVLDLMLPGEDGLTLARRLRTRTQVPIIMLSARGDDIDRIVGLEVGADDYVTKPFSFEGGKRMKVAEQGIEQLSKHVESLITIPNEKLLAVLGKEMSLLNAFKAANDVLLNAVQGIAELITRPGLINVDFADVRTVMSEMGIAMMGSGSASGDKRAREAAETALQSPLLEDINLAGAKGVLVNITAGMDMSIGEFDEVGTTVREYADDDATVVVGTVIDPEMHDELRVTVVATGIGGSSSASRPKPHVEVVKPARVANSDVTENTQQPAASVQTEGSQAAATRTGYSDYDNPTVIRRSPETHNVDRGTSQDMDYLDIPAFLRRQAD